MKYSGNGVFDRRILNRLFGKKKSRPDAECWELENFCRETIIGSGFEFKHWGDFCEFQQEYGAPANFFAKLYDNREGQWLVFEKHEKVNRYSWWDNAVSTSGITFTRRVSEWVDYKVM